MNLSGKAVWQQASGDGERDYAHLCLKLGVILNGYDERCEPLPISKDWSGVTVLARGSPPWLQALSVTKKKKTDLARFCNAVRSGDVVVLRRGTALVLGAGIVDGAHFDDNNFGDIDGWHMPLVRRVHWFWTGESAPKAFKTYDLKLGDTTQALKSGGEVWKWLESLPEPADVPSNVTGISSRTLPLQHEVGIEEISEYLFDKGIASFAIRSLVDQIGELERIARWYQRTRQSPPSESETVAYLVIPLLRVLGWTPQRMAVEWNRVDVALFASLPRSNDSLRVVVEVKKMNNSCLTAESQASRYAAGKTQCHRLILTDGLRYAVHAREPNGTFKLAAYLNLTRMRDQYPALDCMGAQECLFLMAPETSGL